jgi:hypothetical protein
MQNFQSLFKGLSPRAFPFASLTPPEDLQNLTLTTGELIYEKVFVLSFASLLIANRSQRCQKNGHTKRIVNSVL